MFHTSSHPICKVGPSDATVSRLRSSSQGVLCTAWRHAAPRDWDGPRTSSDAASSRHRGTAAAAAHATPVHPASRSAPPRPVFPLNAPYPTTRQPLTNKTTPKEMVQQRHKRTCTYRRYGPCTRYDDDGNEHDEHMRRPDGANQRKGVPTPTNTNSTSTYHRQTYSIRRSAQ